MSCCNLFNWGWNWLVNDITFALISIVQIQNKYILGHIGIVDYDDVELTNIHRQPLHSELTLGMSKVESAAMTLKR